MDDQLPLLTQVTDSSGVRTIAYDQYNEPKTDSLLGSGKVHLVAENRDNLGRNIGYVYKKDSAIQQTIAYGYASDGRIATASFLHSGVERIFNYNYLANSHLLHTLSMPNNMSLTLGYETKRDLLTSQRYKRSSTSVIERDYTYDAIARAVTRRTGRQGTVENDTFAYNNRNELTAATLKPGNFAYDYDNIGNRKTAEELAEEITYTANELNQYTEIAPTGATPFEPEFDLAGNQTLLKTSSGIWTVVYNANNRPTKFTSEDENTVIECDYDYMGRRFMKKITIGSVVTLHERYIYRGYLQIACVDLTHVSYQALWFITWDPTQPSATRPLAIQKDSTWYCYAHDLTKNVCEVLGQHGYIRTTYAYTPFGEVTATGDVTQPIQWSSEYHDTELALIYYNFRHYNPHDGRWPSRDPIGERGGLNLYGFVGSEPISGQDLLGMTGWNWEPLQITDFAVTFDTSLIKRIYGPPRLYVKGGADVLKTLSGMDRALFTYYFSGAGGTYDLSKNATIKNEVANKYNAEMVADHARIKSEVEAFQCPEEDLGGESKSYTIGDVNYSKLRKGSYKSSIWVIGAAHTGISKKVSATVVCACDIKSGVNKPLAGWTDANFKLHFYDQFADAADIFHIFSGAQEFLGSAQFDQIGTWGKKYSQTGVYYW